MLFFAAVSVSTWYGGLEMGLLATALSALVISYFFLTPEFSPLVINHNNLLRLILFIIVTTFITWLNSQLRTAKQRLEINVQRLGASEAKFRRLIDSNIIGVIIADMNGAILEANDAFLKMVGYTREDLSSGRMRWREMIPPKYLLIINQAISDLKTQGVCQPFEQEYIRKDGSYIPVMFGAALLENNSENLISFVLDLSKNRQVELALSQREAEMQLITNAVPVLISYVDHQQYYRFNNKSYEELLGIPASEMYGKHIQEVLGESTYQSIKPYIERVLAGESVTYETQFFSHHKNYYLSVTYIPRFDDEKRVAGFVTLITDITKSKQAEQEREKMLEREQAARAEAEAANRIKDEFLAILSHELRTPLSVIFGWTQLLKKRKLDEQTTDKALETIDRNSHILDQLIKDVLDVSRFIRGKLHLDLHQVELISLITTAIDTVRPAADAKEITIECKLDSNVGVVIGDANRLQQVLWNLLSNAVKFTPKGGKVTVELVRIQSGVQIRVSDNGGGIAPDFLPYVFEHFRQADSSTTRSHGGLGLGLAIVRHLVELHGGTVTVESPGIGQGATFIISLPMKAVAVDYSHLEEISPTLTSELDKNHLSILAGIRVLVVDDEIDTRNLLSTILGQYGAQVLAVASTQEALTALPKFCPDILVSDIGMPQEDGYALIRKLRDLSGEQGGRIPAVALTAYARTQDRTEALLAGFQLHIPKPVNPTELVAVVANLTGRT
jgi:PAS domain S-box-containing protein